MSFGKRKSVDGIDRVVCDTVKIRRTSLNSNATSSNRTVVIPDADGTILLDTSIIGPATLTTNTKFVDPVDTTKKIGFDVSSGTTGKVATMRFAPTNNNTIDFGDVSDSVLFAGATQTLTNKSLNASNCRIVDNSDSTKKLALDASANTTGTTLTLAGSVTSNRTVTFPDPGGNDSVSYLAATQTLTNKSLNASNCRIVDNSDSTKKLALDASANTTGTTLTLAGSVTSNRTVTFPDPGGNDSVSYLAATQTLTNKSLNASNCRIVDNIDSTKKLAFDVSGATSGKTLTLKCTNSDNQTIDLGNASDAVVYRISTQDLLNKNLNNTSVSFFADADPTKKIAFDPSGATASTTLTLGSTVTANRNVTFADPGGDDSVSYLAATQTLTNKSLNASSVKFVDNITNSKKVAFDASGASASTTLTLASTVSANRSVTFADPGANDSVTYLAATQSLSNKSLNATNCTFFDNANNTRKIAFDASTAANSSTLTLSSGLGVSRTYTFPDVGGNANVVLSAGAQSIAGSKTFSNSCFFPTGSGTSAAIGLNGGGAIGLSSTASTDLNLITSSVTRCTINATATNPTNLKVGANGTVLGGLQFGSFTSSSAITTGSTATIGTISLSGFSAVPVITLTMILPSPANNWDGVVLSIVNGATSSSASVLAKNLNTGTTSGTVTVLWMAIGT